MRVRDDERRRREEVHLHLRMDATFEVAVAGQHGAGDDVALRRAPSAISSGSGPELPMQLLTHALRTGNERAQIIDSDVVHRMHTGVPAIYDR